MTATTVFSQPDVSCLPGTQGLSELSILNTGDIVERFDVQVIGLPAEWYTVEPESVSLFPNAQDAVSITLHPPRLPETEAREYPYAVRVVPANDPGRSVVEEGVLTVERLVDINGDVIPRIAYGRLRGKHTLAIDNRGNVPVDVVVDGTDAAGAIRAGVTPHQVTIPPGRTRLCRVRVRPMQRVFRGPMRQRQYKLVIRTGQPEPVTVDAVLSQKPLLPKGAALLGTVTVLVLAWLLLVKPAIKSTAVNGVNSALTQQNAQNQALSSQLASVRGQVTALSTTSTSTTTTSTTTSTTTTTTTLPPTTVTQPTSGTIETVVQPATTGSQSVTVPQADTLTISSILAQNVAGTKGLARLQVLAPGQAAQTILAINLEGLTTQTYPITPPLILTGGEALSLVVACNGDQPACDVSILYGGQKTQPVSASGSTPPAAPSEVTTSSTAPSGTASGPAGASSTATSTATGGSAGTG